MVQSHKREGLKYVTTRYGAVCVEMALISLMPTDMLLAKPLIIRYTIVILSIKLYIYNNYKVAQLYVITEPRVYKNSELGDDGIPNLACKGYKENLNKCDKTKYGNFSCSRRKIAGIKCQDVMYLHEKQSHSRILNYE